MLSVVIPLYRERLTADELLAVHAWQVHLQGLTTYLVIPSRLEGRFSRDFPSCSEVVFDDSWFSTRESYSRLLLTSEFYRSFTDTTNMLLFQLDSLVMTGDLPPVVDEGWDFVGAPLFRSRTEPQQGFVGVGNGGFSLRRVGSFLRVLSSRLKPKYTLAVNSQRLMPDLSILNHSGRFAKALRVIREARCGVDLYASNYTLNEDKFWSFRARLFDPSFRIAPVEKALEFSFECFPRYCYELNGRRLPFGCHAWAKHDRKFWEQFIDRNLLG